VSAGRASTVLSEIGSEVSTRIVEFHRVEQIAKGSLEFQREPLQ
jgi:hypothetical protein